MRAKMVHFYGFSDQEVDKLSISKFVDYWNAITPIEAQKILMDINVSSFSSFKKADRRKFLNEIKKLAYSTIKRGKDVSLTTKEIALRLARKLQGG